MDKEIKTTCMSGDLLRATLPILNNNTPYMMMVSLSVMISYILDTITKQQGTPYAVLVTELNEALMLLEKQHAESNH
jgi:hypothetical protein